MIRRHFVEGAMYGDALPDGEFVALIPSRGLETHRGFVNLPAEEVAAKGFGPLFPRLNPLDGTSFAGASHADLGTWVYQSGLWKLREGSCGTSPIIFDAAGNLHISHCGPVGAQGYRYVAEDGITLVTGDETTSDPSRQIWEFTTLGGVTVGQDGTANKSVLLYNNRRYELTDFEGRFIRLTIKGSKLAITICHFGRGVHFIWLDIADIPLLTEIDVQQSQPPVVVEEPKPMEAVTLPGRVQEIVEELYERNRNLAHSTFEDDRRILARMIAEQARFELGEEWGWKSNHGIGISPAKDAIAKRLGPFTPNQRQKLLMWDLFNGTTRKPNRFPKSETEHMEQFFIPVEPVNHLAVAPPQEPSKPPVVVPNPGTNVPNVGTVVVDLNPTLAPLKAEIAALKAQLVDLKENIQELEGEVHTPTKELKLPRFIALRSKQTGKLLCVDLDKGDEGLVYANRDGVNTWETFELVVVE